MGMQMVSLCPQLKGPYMVCNVWRCCVVQCNHFAMGDCDMFLWPLLFAWTIKSTNNPHVMVCAPLSWGYGLGLAAP